MVLDHGFTRGCRVEIPWAELMGGGKMHRNFKSKTSRGWPVGNHFSRPSERCLWGCQLREILGISAIGNGWNTVSRVLFRRRELTPYWVLGQTRRVLRTRWVHVYTQIIGWKELTELAPRNSVSPEKLTEFGVWNRTLRNRFGPFPKIPWAERRAGEGKTYRKAKQDGLLETIFRDPPKAVSEVVSWGKFWTFLESPSSTFLLKVL